MEVVTFRNKLLTLLSSASYNHQKIGFVPTMGALHNGHTSLIKRAVSECDIVIASIFVNQSQFNENEDFVKYPKKPVEDIEMLDAAGCDLVFMPEADQIYNGSALSVPDLGSVETVMEGAFRPGHFKGMKEVVARLFNLTTPNRAYFGEKDFQQLAIIRSLVKTLGNKIEVVGCPTIRESDGLAMSSRNIRLTIEERKEAGCIYRALKQAVTSFRKHNAKIAQQGFITEVEQSGLFKVEYVSCANSESLEPMYSCDPAIDQRILTAVSSSQTRLIDNIAV